jgi:glycerophosphoryl diester phosphodiesterase
MIASRIAMAESPLRYYDRVRAISPVTAAVFDAAQPLVFAHRGGAALRPENTLLALHHGLSLGADGVELDVHLSRDGIPVVIHDPTLERTTDGTGPVAACTAAELAGLDAAWHFDPAQGYPFRGQGHGVPTLAEVLTRCRHTRLIIEMKFGTPALAEAVVHLVRQAGLSRQVCIGAFHQRPLDVVRQMAPELTTSASRDEAAATWRRSWVRWPFRRSLPFSAYQVPLRRHQLRVVTPAFVAQAHRSGQWLQCWVVDDPVEAETLLNWGVDGLVTDRPDLMVALRDVWVARGGRAASRRHPPDVR